MENAGKLGVIVVVGIIPVLLFLATVGIEIEINSKLSWIMVSISISSALSIPFVYDHIKQNRKKNNAKKFIKKHRDSIDHIRKNDTDLEMILNQIVEDLENIEPYIREAYNEFDYTAYIRKISFIKKSRNKNKLEEYYKLIKLETEDLVRHY